VTTKTYLPPFLAAEIARSGVPLDDDEAPTPTDDEVRDLRRRVAVLEAWVRMVEGHVTGPMSALPTLDEAELQESAGRIR
jgi:hypothetical protein